MEFEFHTSPEQDMAVVALNHAKDWQSFFDQLTDYGNLDEYREQAVTQIDELFPYFGRQVYMSGYGLHLTLDEVTNLPSSENWQYIDHCEGTHNGFVVIPSIDSTGKTYFQVMQQVLIGGQAKMLSNTVLQKLVYSEFLNLDSSCIVVGEFNKLFYVDNDAIELNEQLKSVSDSSKALELLLSSTSFRRMKRKRQEQEVTAIVERTEQHSKLRGAKLSALVEYGYINHGVKKIEIEQLAMNSIIGGVCLGLESLDNLTLKNRAIRRDENLIDRGSGICLMLDPNTETRQELKIDDKKLLYLPSRYIQAIIRV